MTDRDDYVRVQFRSKNTDEWLTEKWLSVDLDNIAYRMVEMMDYYKALGLEFRMDITDNPATKKGGAPSS